MNNGNSTGYLNLERGTRQGDPLSPYRFILAPEILFVQVRAGSSVKGFRIKQFEVKLTAYADDTTLLCERRSVSQKNSKIIKEV